MSALTYTPLILNNLPGRGAITSRIVDVLNEFLTVGTKVAGILIVGFVLAIILDKLTVSVASALGFDSKAQGTPLSGALGEEEGAASATLGTFVRYVVIIFTLLTAIGFMNINAIQTVNQRLLNYAPDVLAASAVLVVGLVVGRAAYAVVYSALEGRTITDVTRKKADDLTSDVEMTESRMAALGGSLIEYYIYLVAILVAADVLSIPPLTRVVEAAVFYAPRLIGAVVIVVLGLIVGTMAGAVVKNSESAQSLSSPAVLGEITKAVIVLFASLIALEAAGASTTLLRTAILVVGLPIGVGLAVAFGLAFGYGARDYIGENIDNWM